MRGVFHASSDAFPIHFQSQSIDLRYLAQLERKLKQLRADDAMIAAEGIEKLTLEELTQANFFRGMRVEVCCVVVLRCCLVNITKTLTVRNQ
jgi:hypothetical protein